MHRWIDRLIVIQIRKIDNKKLIDKKIEGGMIDRQIDRQIDRHIDR